MPSEQKKFGLARVQEIQREGNWLVKQPRGSTGLVVAGVGSGVAAHASIAAARLLTDKVGLTDELSMALTGRSGLLQDQVTGRVTQPERLVRSLWRRRHPHRARTCHYARRGHAPPP